MSQCLIGSCALAFFLLMNPPHPSFGAGEEVNSALLTVAEKSDYQATGRYEDVMTLCRSLDERSESVRLGELGRTTEGRSIPLLFVAEPMVASAQEARASGKLVCLLIGSIHGGEVCGKEALPMLVRELTDEPAHPLLKDLILAVAPLYNADGAERFSPDHRPGQNGPAQGMGQRANAQGLDLNRDFIKLDAPETRALIRFLNEWDPHLFVDIHTTNGSAHRYLLTYDGAKNPAGDQKVLAFTRESFLPGVDARFEDRTDHHAFFYGNFEKDHSLWTSYPAEARYGTTYVGLRNRLSLLSEAYSYAPYRDRVLGTKDFVYGALEYVSANRETIRRLTAEADQRAIQAGRTPAANDLVAIRSKATSDGTTATVFGFEEPEGGGHALQTAPQRDYTATLVRHYEPTLSVRRPFAYLIPADQTEVRDRLQAHGIAYAILAQETGIETEVYRISDVKRSERPYQNRLLQTFETEARTEQRTWPAGTLVVQTGQPLSSLAVTLLEPAAEDGLATWGFLGQSLPIGADFPVARIVEPRPLPLVDSVPRQEPSAPAPAEKKLLTLDVLNGRERPMLPGGGLAWVRWLDATHYLQTRDGKLMKVDAETDQAVPFHDPEKLARALGSLPTIDERTARSLASRSSFDFDPACQGALFHVDHDLYYATFDGSTAVRLTSSPGQEEMARFSPDGRFVAFVRSNDLYVVDIQTQTERALTTGGSEKVRNGKAVWVYFEELFNRDWRAFWWSPDSRRIAFLRLDDRPLDEHVIIDDTAPRRIVEKTPYPFAGDPNPLVQVGMVSVAGGEPRFADLSRYAHGSYLVTHVGWFPEGESAFCYVQDRTQTWLDFVKIPATSGAPEKLFRETTKAWVESPGDPTFLADGTFLWPSERDGWKHLYHFDRKGNELSRVTDGEWEVRQVHHVDSNASRIYVSGTKDSSTGSNLYRIDLGDRCVERLTNESGSHSINFSPGGMYFVDTWSNIQTPTRTVLRSADGSAIKTLAEIDTSTLDRYRLGSRELIQIPARDGFLLEAELILPADLDETKMYPVWFQTYAGPHSPTVSDSWAGGRLRDRALANEGFIIFRMDPRSASGKGALSAWTAYKQLGVKELEDITDAIDWLKQKPYVDPSRIGMTGHSYGGYMTAYAMTHSTLFACGIAGAPVTDWRNYDTIYTERFLLTPQENPEGYDRSSVVKAASNLHGKLLLVHGVKDDNVSFRNSLQLIHALQMARKDFELMIYPESRHGIGNAHYTDLQIDFIRRSLSGGPRARPSSPAE